MTDYEKLKRKIRLCEMRISTTDEAMAFLVEIKQPVTVLSGRKEMRYQITDSILGEIDYPEKGIIHIAQAKQGRIKDRFTYGEIKLLLSLIAKELV